MTPRLTDSSGDSAPASAHAMARASPALPAPLPSDARTLLSAPWSVPPRRAASSGMSASGSDRPRAMCTAVQASDGTSRPPDCTSWSAGMRRCRSTRDHVADAGTGTGRPWSSAAPASVTGCRPRAMARLAKTIRRCSRRSASAAMKTPGLSSTTSCRARHPWRAPALTPAPGRSAEVKTSTKGRGLRGVLIRRLHGGGPTMRGPTHVDCGGARLVRDCGRHPTRSGPGGQPGAGLGGSPRPRDGRQPPDGVTDGSPRTAFRFSMHERHSNRPCMEKRYAIRSRAELDAAAVSEVPHADADPAPRTGFQCMSGPRTAHALKSGTPFAARGPGATWRAGRG